MNRFKPTMLPDGSIDHWDEPGRSEILDGDPGPGMLEAPTASLLLTSAKSPANERGNPTQLSGGCDLLCVDHECEAPQFPPAEILVSLSAGGQFSTKQIEDMKYDTDTTPWITNRQPRRADADKDGDVAVPVDGGWDICGHSRVGPEEPWQYYGFAVHHWTGPEDTPPPPAREVVSDLRETEPDTDIEDAVAAQMRKLNRGWLYSPNPKTRRHAEGHPQNIQPTS